MLTAIREVQIPLLAAMLLGACLVEAWRAPRPHAHPARSDPADLFPATCGGPSWSWCSRPSSAWASG
jgi:hypothetical protein